MGLQGARVVATLLVTHGLEQGRRYTLDKAVARIGRDASNAIRIPDNELSRQHAEVRFENGEYTIVDLISSNGTFVNGQRVSESKLSSGDRIQVGKTVLLFGTGTTVTRADLAKKITLITQVATEHSSAIVKSISQAEGSQFLGRIERADASWLKNAWDHLKVLYETSQAVSHIVDLDELLARILELAFKSIKADRGCILLQNAVSSELECRAVYFRAGVSSEEQIEISQTIIDYVLSRAEGVRTSDAAADQRFSPSQSILRMGIREAICVPMQGRHDTMGVIYLDNRLGAEESLDPQRAPSRLTDDHLKLLIAIGHQAALAIEDTRYYEAKVHAERLAAVGQTIATLSHEIKNILQGIKGGSHLIEMGLSGGGDDQVRRGWNIVNKNQNKIYNLVMDMLTFSKEREPAFETCDLNEVVREVVELMEQRASEIAVKLQFVADESFPPIAIDPEGIHRAVLNIVTNALDATEQKEGGAVEVRTKFDPAQAVARVHVLDNGVGIAPEELPQIFALFSSTKGARGTGIGLPVSDKIVREHGGQIRVESQPGEGTEFIIELPVRTDSPTVA
jgi:signal transduction histidine kinase/pSer/pThr/pTyr-binding forkhead associated (FHA) protein